MDGMMVMADSTGREITLGNSAANVETADKVDTDKGLATLVCTGGTTGAAPAAMVHSIMISSGATRGKATSSGTRACTKIMAEAAGVTAVITAAVEKVNTVVAVDMAVNSILARETGKVQIGVAASTRGHQDMGRVDMVMAHNNPIWVGVTTNMAMGDPATGRARSKAATGVDRREMVAAGVRSNDTRVVK